MVPEVARRAALRRTVVRGAHWGREDVLAAARLDRGGGMGQVVGDHLVLRRDAPRAQLRGEGRGLRPGMPAFATAMADRLHELIQGAL